MLSLDNRLRIRQRGVALILTLVLLSLLVIVMLALVGLTRVESSSAENVKDVAAARQNALQGMNIALGQLQRYAGSDKQNTARSDITGVTAPNQLYFTGTWDDTGTLTSWLVSGNENDPTGTGSGITPAEALDASGGTFPVNDATSQVYLLGRNSVTADADGVLVAKQAITAPAGSVPGFTTAETVGHYAWWVGDEGVKVSASLIDPLLVTNPASNDPISYDNSGSPVGDDWANDAKRERLNQLQLPRPRLEKIFTTVDPDLPANVIAQWKVQTRGQLSYLNGSPTGAQVRSSFHDVTPLSRGVLADTTAGTLRADLSGSVATAGAIGSYQSLKPVTVPVTAPLGVEAEYFPVAPSPITGIWPTYGITPPLTEAGLRFYFTVVAGELVTNVILDAEVWNPYAATLKTDAGHILRLRVTIPNELKFRVTDNVIAPAVPAPPQVVTLTAGTIYTADIDTTITWQPGQVIRLGSVAGGALGTGSIVPITFNVATALTDVDTVESLDTVPNLKFELLLITASATDVLQDVTLSSTTFTAAAPTGAGMGEGLGYGYEFNRDLRRWTSEGTPAAEYRDPRLPQINGGFNEPTATSQWKVDPSSNTTGISGTGVFTNNARVVLFDLPRQEITSVAQLRHMIGAKAYELGSSWGGAVNNRFDSHFVSTVPQIYGWSPTGSEPRPNRYLDVYTPDGVPAGTITDLRSPTDSARFQLIRGAFNINSTSVPAWTAVLGAKLTNWDHSGSGAGGVNLDNAFLRVEHGAQQRTNLTGTIPPLPVSTNFGSLSDTQLLGATGRQLTNTQVTDLATEIVRLLKTPAYQKPFSSLSAFVNSGLIQQAINNINLNATLGNSGAGDVELSYSAAALTQGDVVASIAPFMAARSDTFVIRSYGDVRNPATGDIESRVWCEATVQRVPDLVSNPAAAVGDVINPPVASNPFGRRFKIVSFRWLSSTEL